MLHHLTAIAEKSVNSQGQEVWALNERSRTYLTFANWTIWLASVTGGLIFAINWVASGKTDVALCEYLVFIDNFWAAKPLYIMNGLHGFHYLPVMLVIGTPLGWVSVPVAGAIFGLLSIGFLAWSIYKLAEAIAPDHPAAAAGSILFASAVGATNSVLLFQMQTPMTAAMICAAVAGMSGRWRVLAAWLVVASAVKPLAIVMAMLAFVTVPQTRVPFIIGFAALLLIPFGFGDWNYLLAQYREYAGQLATITNAVPGHWYAQTEISTLLRAARAGSRFERPSGDQGWRGHRRPGAGVAHRGAGRGARHGVCATDPRHLLHRAVQSTAGERLVHRRCARHCRARDDLPAAKYRGLARLDLDHAGIHGAVQLAATERGLGRGSIRDGWC